MDIRIVTLLVTLLAIAEGGCPGGFNIISTGNSTDDCYLFIHFKDAAAERSWKSAYLGCSNIGAHLAVLSDVDKVNRADAVVKNSGLNPEDLYWIGLTSDAKSGQIHWIQNEPFRHESSPWLIGEPHQYEGTETYGAASLVGWKMLTDSPNITDSHHQLQGFLCQSESIPNKIKGVFRGGPDRVASFSEVKEVEEAAKESEDDKTSEFLVIADEVTNLIDVKNNVTSLDGNKAQNDQRRPNMEIYSRQGHLPTRHHQQRPRRRQHQNSNKREEYAQMKREENEQSNTRDNSHIKTRDNSNIKTRDNSNIKTRDNSHNTRDNSHNTRDISHNTRDNSHIKTRDNSNIKTRDNSHNTRDNSHNTRDYSLIRSNGGHDRNAFHLDYSDSSIDVQENFQFNNLQEFKMAPRRKKTETRQEENEGGWLNVRDVAKVIKGDQAGEKEKVPAKESNRRWDRVELPPAWKVESKLPEKKTKKQPKEEIWSMQPLEVSEAKEYLNADSFGKSGFVEPFFGRQGRIAQRNTNDDHSDRTHESHTGRRDQNFDERRNRKNQQSSERFSTERQQERHHDNAQENDRPPQRSMDSANHPRDIFEWANRLQQQNSFGDAQPHKEIDEKYRSHEKQNSHISPKRRNRHPNEYIETEKYHSLSKHKNTRHESEPETKEEEFSFPPVPAPGFPFDVLSHLHKNHHVDFEDGFRKEEVEVHREAKKSPESRHFKEEFVRRKFSERRYNQEKKHEHKQPKPRFLAFGMENLPQGMAPLPKQGVVMGNLPPRPPGHHSFPVRDRKVEMEERSNSVELKQWSNHHNSPNKLFVRESKHPNQGKEIWEAEQRQKRFNNEMTGRSKSEETADISNFVFPALFSQNLAYQQMAVEDTKAPEGRQAGPWNSVIVPQVKIGWQPSPVPERPATPAPLIHGTFKSSLCANRKPGAYPHPDDCNKYIVCFEGMLATEYQCGYKRRWHGSTCVIDEECGKHFPPPKTYTPYYPPTEHF